MSEGTPISYMALAKGTAVRTVGGRAFGVVEHVLQIPSEDLFDGIVVKTDDGIRFVDRDQITTITDVAVTTVLDDAAVQALPRPDGPPIYDVDATAGTGHELSDWVNRVFGRGKWKLKDPDEAP
jgi:hypothetical protein